MIYHGLLYLKEAIDIYTFNNLILFTFNTITYNVITIYIVHCTMYIVKYINVNYFIIFKIVSPHIFI